VYAYARPHSEEFLICGGAALGDREKTCRGSDQRRGLGKQPIRGPGRGRRATGNYLDGLPRAVGLNRPSFSTHSSLPGCNAR